MNDSITSQPFDPAAFNKQLAFDDAARSAMIAVAVVATIFALLMPAAGGLFGLIAPAIVIGLWLWWSTSTAKAGRDLAQVAGLLTNDPQQAERLIQDALARRPVMRWARLLSYHRLAGLRHLERHFDESAAICLCLLNQPLKGPAASVRPHLLLMLAEAQLERGDLPGAYHALAHLQQSRLSLAEALQRLALQTRYEFAAGAYDAMLKKSRAKVELAELMPAPLCAAMHGMLATAARRTGEDRLAAWLSERTRLLAPAHLVKKFDGGQFSFGIVEHSPLETDPTPTAGAS